MKLKYPTSIVAAAICFSLAAVAYCQATPIINEVMSSNNASLEDEDMDTPDWVELYNPDATTFSLNGLFLTDDPDNLTRWAFPDVSIPAKSYLVIFASRKDRDDPTANLHTNFSLTSDGEYLALVAADGQSAVSEVQVPALDSDTSYNAITVDGNLSYEITNVPSPNAENTKDVVVFSLTGRAFSEDLRLELSSPSGKSIRYTEDGRQPTLFNGKTYSSPILINRTKLINASVSGGLARTEAFIQIDPALATRDSDIPMVIVHTDSSLKQNGFEPMAIGVIEPNPETGRARITDPFSVNSYGGIRTRGETSNSFPKKPLRFEFWDPNEDDRDLAVLGMSPDSDWVLNARYSFDRTLIHNAWIYELSNQIGQYAVDTRFVELFNHNAGEAVSEGNYQGVYTLLEKIKRGGGRVDVEPMAIEATEEPEITGGYVFRHDKTDPNTWDFTGGSVSMQMIYPAEEERSQRSHQRDWIVGHLNEMRDAIKDNGSDPETGYPHYINEQAWIDHQLLNLLTLNVDALRLSAYFYKENGGKVIAGPVWDFDRSAGGTSDSRTTNALTWRGSGGDQGTHFFSNRGSGAAGGTPVWWHDLFVNADFHTAWTDRWHELRKAEFSDENLSAIIDGMGAELAESAERNFIKWRSAGPRNAGQLQYSDKDGYDGEIEHMKNWILARAEWITNEIIQVPSITPTEPVQNVPVTITMKAGGSLFSPDVIYYTTDGSDPRAPGGEPSANAKLYEGSIAITESTFFRARKKDDSFDAGSNGPPQTWSGIAEARYFVDVDPANSDNLVVSEVMYNPLEPSEAEKAAGFENKDSFEFIELLNTGSATVDLSGARLRGGADVTFDQGTTVAPGERVVVPANVEAFAARYGTNIAIDDGYNGNLANGDRITVRAYDGSTIVEFTYSDNAPWPTAADGDGKSLELVNATSKPDPTQASSWAASAEDNGTPGAGPGEGGGPVDPPVAGGLSDWLADQFSAADLANDAISGPTADTDGDGLPTLAEYLLGGDPLSSNAEKLPLASITDNALTLTYNQRQDIFDVDVAVELSTDLQTWQTMDANKVSVTANGNGTETVVIRDTKPLTGQAVRYTRLRITLK